MRGRINSLCLMVLLACSHAGHAQTATASPTPGSGVTHPVAGTAPPTSTASQQATDATQNVPADPSLRIGGGDLLSVSVFDVQEMSGKFRVEENGDVALPLLGVVHAGGQTAIQLEATLRTELMRRRLILDPQVLVQILEFSSQSITVGGEVQKPGIFPAIGSHRLYDMLALGGGLTPLAGHTATIFRRGSDTGIAVEIRDRYGAPEGNVSLNPGDTVVVQRAGIVYVLGDLQKPGGFLIDRTAITVLQALSLAQGPTKTASLGSARILRKEGSTYQNIPVDVRPLLKAQAADMELHDGDVLYVPVSGFKNFYQNSTQGIVSSLAAATIYALDR